jgi:hypothetical protein
MRYSFENIMLLSDYQKCREMKLCCDNCHQQWYEAVPRTYRLVRYPCPYCEMRGTVIAMLDRMGDPAR